MIEAITLKGANVSAFQDAMIHDAVFKQNGVFRYGSNLEAEIKTNNLVSLKDGIFVFQGRYARIKSGATEDVRIKNGRSGVTRKDLIVLHFETDGFTETMDIRCITGEENGNVPAHATGDSLAGTTTVEMPLYVVSLNGLSIESVTRKFDYIEPIGGYLRGLAPTNLLINGDFQCNQRGQTKYVGGLYTLDMWASADKCEVDVLSDGWIRFSNKDVNPHAIKQYIKGNGDTYTIVLKTRNKTGQGAFLEAYDSKFNNLFKKDITNDGVFVYTFNTSLGLARFMISCYGNSSIEIEYVDLFEGDIAYPHIKEDYELALKRCMRYLYKLPRTFVAGSYTDPVRVYAVSDYLIYMDKSLSKTIVSESGTEFDINTGSTSLANPKGFWFTSSGTIGIELNKRLKEGASYVFAISKGSIVITCEPL